MPNMLKSSANSFVWLGIALASLLPIGCGSADSDLVPLKGRVTLDGGPWPVPGFITFAGESRPLSVPFDQQGNFEASAYQGKKGVVPGTYKIGIECYEVQPTFDNPEAGKSVVPEKYQNPGTSGLEVTLELGSPVTDYKLDIPTSE